MREREPSGPRDPWRWLNHWPGGLALITLCLACYLPGLRSIPPVDRDESRFAHASRQMLRSGSAGGWIVPRIGDRPRLNKPPLIYWLQAGSAALLGSESPELDDRPRLETARIWVYRVPSVLCATLAVLCLWRLGRRLFPTDHLSPWLAAAMLATAVIVLWDARQARADQLLLLVTTAAVAALWECWVRGGEPGGGERVPRPWRLREGPEVARFSPGLTAEPASPGRRSTSSHDSPATAGSSRKLTSQAVAPVALWTLVGIGVLAKGPITAMVVGLIALCLAAMTGCWRWLWSLRPGMGLVIVTLIVGPWVALVMREVGVGAYMQVLRDEVLGRSVTPSEGHWGPPGYHLMLLPLMFWPGSLFTAAGIVGAWKTARATDEAASGVRRWWRRWNEAAPAELFLLAWIFPSWIVFELVNTKLPHYTLPLYPALALLSARAVSTAAGRARGLGVGGIIWLIIGSVLVSGAAAGLARVFGFAAPNAWMITMGAGVGIGAGLIVAAARALYKRSFILAQVLGFFAACVGSAVMFGVVLPRLSSLWISSRLLTVIERADPSRTGPVAAAGYSEDSLQYLLEGRLERVRLTAMSAWAREHPGGLLVLPTEHAQETLGGSLDIRGRAAGFNYSKGEWVDLVVVRSTAE